MALSGQYKPTTVSMGLGAGLFLYLFPVYLPPSLGVPLGEECFFTIHLHSGTFALGMAQNNSRPSTSLLFPLSWEHYLVTMT